MEITEKIVCFWSKKHYEKERRENQKFIEYLESVIAFPDKLKDGQKKIEKFLQKMEVDKSTGEVVDTATHLSLDMAKIQEYRSHQVVCVNSHGSKCKQLMNRDKNSK